MKILNNGQYIAHGVLKFETDIGPIELGPKEMIEVIYTLWDSLNLHYDDKASAYDLEDKLLDVQEKL